MIFRLSHKLATKIKAGALGALPPHEDPLADWSARLFVAGRTQYLLLSNTKALSSAVVYGRGITNDGRFVERALGGIREVMEADGQGVAYRRLIVPATASVRFAKALGRSVTGSMNDLIKHATYWLAGGDRSPFDVSFRLNDIPMSALAGGGSAYGKPREAFRALAGGVGP
jgi:hypothetical protein